MRNLDVYFYGIFMDAHALAAQGFHPGVPHLASVVGYELRIGERASLFPCDGGVVWGVVMALPSDEIDALYGAPPVADYRPEAVLAGLGGGRTTAALCFNLMNPEATAPNKQYASELGLLAKRLKLPADYVSTLEALAA